MRILVVEDSPTQGEALRSALVDQRFDVELVTSGEHALERIESSGTRFDLVVSDVVMPGIDGYELCRRIKAGSHADIPVVLLTSLTDPMAIVRGLECGADNYVTKPYALDHLMARIRNALDKYSLRSGSKSSMGVNVRFLDATFTITSGKEQILDLFISSIEDVVRMNDALHASQRELASAQKRLEQFAARMAHEAQVTAEKYSALMHSANDAIFVVDRNGRIADANVRAGELLDEARSMTERRLSEFVDPESRAQFSELLMMGGTGGGGRGTNIVFLRGDGRRVYCDVAVSRASEDGSELSLVILHDVTGRRNNEEMLRRNREQLAEAQHIARMGSFEWDPATGAFSSSDELLRIFGVKHGAGVHTLPDFLAFAHADDQSALDHALRSSVRTASPFSLEFRIVRPDGVVRHVQALGQFRDGHEGSERMFIGTIMDVTDRRQLEEQLRQSQKMDAIGQLAGGIAHDFNNLLTVIQGNTEFALAALEPSAPARGDLAEIKQAALSAGALTQQLLAFSRRQVLQPRPIQLPAVAHGIERMLGRLIGENIDLVFDLPDDSGYVLADPGQIEQVMMNLTVNARDAMPSGGRIVISTASTTVGENDPAHPALSPGQYETLRVSDTGIGMDGATLERIFEPFFTTKPAGRGTGLGLSTVHGIIKQSGGELRVESEPGRGTVFTIYLPTVPASATDAPRRETTSAGRGTERILVVEDEASLRKLARRVLLSLGYDVAEAVDGDQALRLCETAEPFNLIVTDVVMPGMQARDMVERIAETQPGAKVLFMSGYHDDHAMLRDFETAKIEFLHKPFTPAELANKVRMVLDRGKEERAPA